jgi:hypothetical protein
MGGYHMKLCKLIILVLKFSRTENLAILCKIWIKLEKKQEFNDGRYEPGDKSSGVNN